MKQTVKKRRVGTAKTGQSKRRKIAATRHAKRLLVPHAHNKYQPHLIRPAGLVVVVLLVLAVQAIYNFSSGGSVLGGESNLATERLLALTNSERASRHQKALKFDSRLAAAASLKASDMIKHNYWAHTGPDGTSPWQWLKQADYSYSYAGENLAKDFKTAEAVTAAWMSSDEHKKNILGEHYTDAGFAVVSGELNGKETTLVVAMYGTPKTVAEVAQPAVLAATDSPSPMARFGAHLQSMTPLALSSIVLLLVTAAVAGVAHLYRKRLPKPVRVSWRRHHGLYKAVGMTCLAIILIALYGSGQI